jgi:hypothetical protein
VPPPILPHSGIPAGAQTGNRRPARGYSLVSWQGPCPQEYLDQVAAVTRAYRGHRLGLLVKVAMTDLLAGAEPRIQHIVTFNADANRHMIAINAELGFRVLDQWQEWQLDVARAAAPAASASASPIRP